MKFLEIIRIFNVKMFIHRIFSVSVQAVPSSIQEITPLRA